MFGSRAFLGQVSLRLGAGGPSGGAPSGGGSFNGSPSGAFSGPPGGGPSGGPSGSFPSVSVAPTVHDGGFVPNDVDFGWWGWPNYYPSYYYPPPPPPNQRMICKKLADESEKQGTDVFECHYEPVAPTFPMTTYPVVRMFPLY